MEFPKYVCVVCDHSIPLSIQNHRDIVSGKLSKPKTCFDCQRLQDQLTEELED